MGVQVSCMCQNCDPGCSTATICLREDESPLVFVHPIRAPISQYCCMEFEETQISDGSELVGLLDRCCGP